MQSPIRIAFVAALAAFALGACSGGGGITPGDRSKFFPVKAGQVTHGLADVPEVGTTLENVLVERLTDIGYRPFNEFQFGAATNANGIPLQKATKTEAGRYAAVAYQAVLEHSMFLVQGGFFALSGSDDLFGPRGLRISTGVPSTGSPVAGTWTGKAVAAELPHSGRDRPVAEIDAQAERFIVQATQRLALPSTATIRMSLGHSGTGKAGAQSIRTSRPKGP